MFLALILVFIQAATLIGAQADVEKDAKGPAVIEPLPFQPGETLVYDASFSKLIFSGTIGEITLRVAKPTEAQKPGFLELNARAVSRGFFPKLFGVKLDNSYTSVVFPKDIGLYTSTTKIEEGNRRRLQKSIVNRETGRVTYIDRNIADESSEPTVEEGASPSWVLDVLSAIYFVRTQQMKPGETISLPLSDGAKTYTIEVVADQQEEIKVDAGKFKTMRLDVKAFDGRYVRHSGEMTIWVSEDADRIPVRAKIKTAGTTVDIKLKEVSRS